MTQRAAAKTSQKLTLIWTFGCRCCLLKCLKKMLWGFSFLSGFEWLVYCTISDQGCRIKSQKPRHKQFEKKKRKRKKCSREVKKHSQRMIKMPNLEKSQMKVAVKGRREQSLKSRRILGMRKRSVKPRLARQNRRVPDGGWINVLQGYSAV